MSNLPDWARRAREKWRYTGTDRPSFAAEAESGQESVWDYSRPPRVVPDERRVSVRVGNTVLADTRAAFRILETASAPTFYVPPRDLRRDLLRPAGGGSWCEWKGRAAYWSVVLPHSVVESAGWSYAEPWPGYEAIAHYVSFYPALLECYVEGERASPQPGGFYGGWVTSDVVGPIKGAAGTSDW